MKNFFKGFIVGIGKIIPGVSGAILAISMGIYDKSLDYISNFKANKKESIKYLFPIGLGLILSIIFFSKIISISLNKYYVITMLFFIGLIIGGIPFVFCKVKKNDYYIVIITFITFFLVSLGSLNNVYNVKNNFIDYIIFFLSGIVEAIGTVVPGISSTALLMVIGTYNTIVDSVGNLNNIKILIPFTIGIILGLYFVVKLINYLFKRYEHKVYAFVLGVLLSSIILLIIQSIKNEFEIIELILGLVFMLIGIFVANIMEKK
jgi:putative membrane protein